MFQPGIVLCVDLEVTRNVTPFIPQLGRLRKDGYFNKSLSFLAIHMLALNDI